MKGLDNRIISQDELSAEAKRLGSIEELLKRAKEVLATSIMDINEPLSIVNADVFIEEARERLKQLTDSDEQKKYEAAIEEVDAMWKKKCDEVMK